MKAKSLLFTFAACLLAVPAFAQQQQQGGGQPAPPSPKRVVRVEAREEEL